MTETAKINDLTVNLSALHDSFETILNQAVKKLENLDITSDAITQIVAKIGQDKAILNEFTTPIVTSVTDHLLNEEETSAFKETIISSIESNAVALINQKTDDYFKVLLGQLIDENYLAEIITKNLNSRLEFKSALKCQRIVHLLLQMAEGEMSES